MMRLFIAGASSHRLAVRAIIDQVAALGYTVTYDWTRAPEWDLSRDLTYQEAAAVSRENREGVEACEGFIWVLDGAHQSLGAHYEAGLAEGLRKPMVLLLLSGDTPATWIHTKDHVWSTDLELSLRILERHL